VPKFLSSLESGGGWGGRSSSRDSTRYSQRMISESGGGRESKLSGRGGGGEASLTLPELKTPMNMGKYRKAEL